MRALRSAPPVGRLSLNDYVMMDKEPPVRAKTIVELGCCRLGAFVPWV